MARHPVPRLKQHTVRVEALAVLQQPHRPLGVAGVDLEMYYPVHMMPPWS